MFKNIIRAIGGDPNKREIERLAETVAQAVNELEEEFEALSDEQLLSKTAVFRERLSQGEILDDLIPEAFAAVREASKRTLGLRHYDVQLICGAVLHQGKIAEMRTGEGKTLAATLPLYLNALEGKGVHLVTVNDYLARRDARWMAPIFTKLGMKVGVLQMAARTDGAKKAFVIDLERSSPQEDRDQLMMVPRKDAYDADITYGTNSEFGFDYLRDNQAVRKGDRVQRGHHYVIIDEVDNILIDEARTPLIISGPASDNTEWYVRMAQVVDRLRPEDYEVSERDRTVALTEVGETRVEDLLDISLRDPERPEDITPEQARLLGFLEQALRAKHLFHRNKDYLVQAGRVIIIDSSTGRMMPGRRWSEGLHQAVEAKEGARVNPENVTYATITLQNYYRMYEKLSGMTGTALTESEEFYKIYQLDVLPIPTNLEYIVSRPVSSLEERKAKDETGFEYQYFARKDDSESIPVFWRRKDYTDVVYRTTEAKLRAIAQEAIKFHVMGRPQLIGTTSVENSEILSRRLNMKSVRTLLQTILIRHTWMEQNGIDFITRSEPGLQSMNISLDELNPGKLRAAAKELQVDISMNLEDDQNLNRLLEALDLNRFHRERLLAVIKGGVPHMVLNARKHDEESKMIERAGAFGAVTIATNMAGRGVDIKLGGELPESVMNDVVRVLENLGKDPYEMSQAERLEALGAIPLDKLSVVRADSVKAFMEYVQNMETVKALGGLHVIGSERYEARRIDNQLRGRAARQGDPGSSRYYLSLEDDLMRLFGGQQVESLWGRVFTDDSMPMEMRLLGRIVEQSQERVEGANFDARKHVLEYDDVLNEQRKRIYGQRDRVFEKEDLREDVLEMLRTELQNRIQTGMQEEEGPWRLMAFLEQIQPTLDFESLVYPSYPMRILLDEIKTQLEKREAGLDNVRTVLVDIASKALQARQEHYMHGASHLLDTAEENLRKQQQERYDTLDAFLEGIRDWDEPEQMPGPAEIIGQLSDALRLPLKLTNAEVKRLLEGDEEVEGLIRSQIDSFLMNVSLKRVIGSLGRRLGENLEFGSDLEGKTWDDVYDDLLDMLEDMFALDRERLIGDNGQIISDLNGVLPKIEKNLMDERNLISLLMLMTQGSKTVFDSKTHKRATRRFTRLTYPYLVAKLMEGTDEEEASERILTHLEHGLRVLELVRGLMEWKRISPNEVTLNQLEKSIRTQLIQIWGLERFDEVASKQLSSLTSQEQSEVREMLGSRLQNEAYREILVRVISSQWVEYLTQIDALRISIGMEAYAQRDPLVQYKLKASGMFQGLLADIRMGVISRLFTFQLRRDAGVAIEREKVSTQTEEQPTKQEISESGKKRKKRRKRH